MKFKKHIVAICAALIAGMVLVGTVKADSIMPEKQEAYRRGFKGEGTVVAIIDSGADVTHPDFKLTETEQVKLTKEKVETIISASGLKGKYVSEKIPYVHDYFHEDNDIFSRDAHGIHVAGIVGANGEVKGVAPETQLLLMKVFPDSGIHSVLDSDKYYVTAIRDAILLGADVINLSLGTGAGSEAFLSEEVKNGIKEATEKGIIVNVASGNNGYYGFMRANPKSENPDYGVTAMPAILKETIAVASLNGDTLSATMLVIDNEKFPYKEAYTDALSIAGKLPYGEQIKVVDVGYGMEDEYTGKDVDGAVVLARRGKRSFRELQREASRKFAKGIIIYNQTEKEDELFEIDGSEFTVPVAVMRYRDVQKILEKIKQGHEIEFLQDEESYVNPDGGSMSMFSSWGLTNEGILKPDVSAPGGDILSLGNHGKHIRMSGTSMATPYISGVSALVVQRLKETFDRELTPKERFKMVKKVLMSTAKPHKTGEIPTSPRKQGSGIVDIRGAVASQVIAYADEETININLGDVSEQIQVPMTLENISNKKLTLKGSYSLLADEVSEGRFTLKSKVVKSGTLNPVVLLPKEKKQIYCDIDIRDIDLSAEMKNGYFLDGYLTFEYGRKKPKVGVAFTSFKGVYENLPILEEPIYELENFDSTYVDRQGYSNHFTHLGSAIMVDEEEKHIVLGEQKDSVIGNRKFDKNGISFSPNGDGKADSLEFVFTALRTYQKITIDIYDKNDRLVETFAKIKKPEFIKNYYGGDDRNELALNLWKYVPERTIENGEYHAKVTAKRFLNSKYAQEIHYKFYIDTEKPKLVWSKVEDGKLTFECSDDLSGVKSVKVKVDEEELRPGADGSYELRNISKNRVRIHIYDNAYNESIVTP